MSWFRNNWHIIVVVGAGLIAWGGLEARVAQVEEDVQVTQTDHDLLIKLSTQQDNMQKQLDRIENSVGSKPGGVR